MSPLLSILLTASLVLLVALALALAMLRPRTAPRLPRRRSLATAAKQGCPACGHALGEEAVLAADRRWSRDLRHLLKHHQHYKAHLAARWPVTCAHCKYEFQYLPATAACLSLDFQPLTGVQARPPQALLPPGAPAVDRLWQRVHPCFAGSPLAVPPEVEIVRINAAQAAAIFDYLLKHARLDGQPEFWYESRKQWVAVTAVPNAAAPVARHQADPFHLVLLDLQVGEVTLPPLGLFVFQDVFNLDYQLGPKWQQPQVAAFFILLQHLARLAPNALIRPSNHARMPHLDLFLRAWSEFPDLARQMGQE